MFFFSPSKFPSWKTCFWIARAHQVGSAEGWTSGWKRAPVWRRATHGELPWALPLSCLGLILEEKILRTFLRKRSTWEWFVVQNVHAWKSLPYNLILVWVGNSIPSENQRSSEFCIHHWGAVEWVHLGRMAADQDDQVTSPERAGQKGVGEDFFRK